MPLRPAERGAGSTGPGRPAHSPRGGRPSLVRWRIGVSDPRLCWSSAASQAARPAQSGRALAAADPRLFGGESAPAAFPKSEPDSASQTAQVGLRTRPAAAGRRSAAGLCCRAACRSAQQSEAPARILHQGSQVGLRTRPAAAGRRLFGGESTCRTPASAAPQASASGLCRAAAPSRARRRLRLPPRAVR